MVLITLHKRMKFPIKETEDLVTFTVEILNEKLHFLCTVSWGDDDELWMQKHMKSQGVIQKFFLGGGGTRKCDNHCDQALIESSWGSV